MLLWLVEGLGVWQAPIVALWLATAALVVHRVAVRAAVRRRERELLEGIDRLDHVWQTAVDPAERVRRARNLGFDRVVDALEAGAEADPVVLLEPANDGAQRGEGYLVLIAQVAPLIGLAGTVAGYFATLQTVAQTGLGNAFAAFVGPASLAMKTTLGGLVPTIVAYLAIGLVPVDHERRAARDAILRVFARMQRVARRSPPMPPPMALPIAAAIATAEEAA